MLERKTRSEPNHKQASQANAGSAKSTKHAKNRPKQQDDSDAADSRAASSQAGYRVALNHRDQEVLVRGDADALSGPGRASYAGTKFEFEGPSKFNKLARLLTYYVEVRMEQQFGMQTKLVPFKNDMTDSSYAKAPIFVSADWKDNTKRALVLIQGTGEVRAGVWSRKAMINESLNCGSMLPQIKFAVANGMACLVMNPNYTRDEDGRDVDPKVNGMLKHAQYVFKKYVVNRCQAEEIFIIAHSRGGWVLMELFKRFTGEMMDRVAAVALTDSAHTDIRDDLIDTEEVEWISDK